MVRCGSKAAAEKTSATTKAASKKAEKAEIAAVQAKFKDTREKEQAHQSQVDARISAAKRGVLTARRLAAKAAGTKIAHGEAPPAILPHHTSHYLQTLDLGWNKAWRKAFRAVVDAIITVAQNTHAYLDDRLCAVFRA